MTWPRGAALPKPPSKPNKIAPWAQWVAGIVGVIGLAGGGIATFTESVEAGPVAMIAVGALFLIVGLSGALPTRLKIGDNEAEWQAVQEFVEATVEGAPPEDRPEQFDRLRELAKAAPRAAASAIDAVIYEQTVLEMLRQIAHEVRPQITTSSNAGPSDMGIDMTTIGPTGKRALVQIKTGVGPSKAWYERIYQQIRQLMLADATVLIITPHKVGAAAEAVMADHDDLKIIRVRGAEDLDYLADVVKDIVGPIED
jgi:hypothetical protein